MSGNREKALPIVLGVVLVLVLLILGIIYIVSNTKNGSYEDKAEVMFEDITETVVNEEEEQVQEEVKEEQTDVPVNNPVEEVEVTLDQTLSAVSDNPEDWMNMLCMLVYSIKVDNTKLATEIVEKYKNYMTYDLYNALFINADYLDNAEMVSEQVEPDVIVEESDEGPVFVVIKNSNGEVTEFIDYEQYILKYGVEPDPGNIVDYTNIVEEESPTATTVTFVSLNTEDINNVVITLSVDGELKDFIIKFEESKVFGFQ